MSGAHQDFETGSPTDLLKSGVHRYAEDPDTRIHRFSYRINGGEVKGWMPGYPDPIDLLEYLANGGILTAHNAMFERTMWNKVLRVKYAPHWPVLRAEQQDCTMARAAAVGHPQKLEALCEVLQTEHRKDIVGEAVMKRMAKPRAYNPDGTYVWWDSAEDYEALRIYNDLDVLTEEDAGELLPHLTDYERKVWLLDQKINDRGIKIDLQAVKRCDAMVTHAKKNADREMRSLSNRTVPKCTNDAKIIEFINSRGIECTTVKKGVKDDLLFYADLKGDKTVERVINLRSAAKKTSTAKFAAMLKCVCKDGRIYGLLNYWGAGPGRWAGRLVQPQNFPRFDYDDEGYILEWFHDILKDESLTVPELYDLVVMIHGCDYPLLLLSKSLRSMIVADENKKLVGGDFSNIEGRLAAWFANETWKLKAFADYDAGIGDDLYRIAYAKSFGLDITQVDGGKSKGPMRQIGKVEELALGYQGSVGAVLEMGPTYGVDPYKLSAAVIKNASPVQWEMVSSTYASSSDKFGLQLKEWTAIKILVQNWRKANNNITQSWWELQDAAVEAVSAPGQVVPALGGKVSYYSDGRILWCVLPSGRMIAYSFPKIETSRVKYIDKYTGEERERVKNSVSFWGWKEGRWQKAYLYGGLQFENIVQGTARCVMVDRMFAAEEAGYPIILTVHDELLTEPWNSPQYNEKDFQRIMSVVPSFVTGLPMAAVTWEDLRYIK